jgi:hypothetical protein
MKNHDKRDDDPIGCKRSSPAERIARRDRPQPTEIDDEERVSPSPAVH